ncbi:hypothetical protein L7F22_067227 [Adiantum nelumboides]|nr:hypothetical protein [Adiantum nelumboides]
MSRSLATPKASSDLLSVSFNQDGSCVSIGTRKGYSIANAEPFGKRQSTICELVFPTTVLGVKLNRRRLVVILEEEIYIYDISNMKLLHTIETSPNPHAICALSPSSDPCYLAYPSPVPSPNSPFSQGASQHSPGDVLIFDLVTLSVTNIIQAHKTPISSLALNSTGTMLATASDKGTVIRVFSVPGAQKLFQFRRGSYPARIYNISFNAVSSCCVFRATRKQCMSLNWRKGRKARALLPTRPCPADEPKLGRLLRPGEPDREWTWGWRLRGFH